MMAHPGSFHHKLYKFAKYNTRPRRKVMATRDRVGCALMPSRTCFAQICIRVEVSAAVGWVWAYRAGSGSARCAARPAVCCVEDEECAEGCVA